MNINTLVYYKNSCYQDSVLMALLAVPNRFITENMLAKRIKDKELKNIQSELSKITLYIRQVIPLESYNCLNLRKALSKYKIGKFSKTAQEDSGEFLLYLFDIFSLETLQIQRSIYFFKEKLYKSSDVIEKSSPIISIITTNKEDIDLESYLYSKEDSEIDPPYKFKGKFFSRKIEKRNVLNPSYIVFNVQRLKESYKRSYNKVICKKTLGSMELFSIVLHSDKHYTAMLKIQGRWYLYNDIEENMLEEIGTFKSMINHPRSPMQYGTLFFYST